jgi:clan AA aspartic protease (TIGR02281 family)
MEQFQKALMDQISALDLLGNPEKVAAQQYYEIATMYAALGRFCEAATPLETFLSFHSTIRVNPQLERLINEYRFKGNCQLTKRNERTTSVPFKKSGGVILVEANLNDVSGLFVLDTGAEVVSIKRSFANKANVLTSEENIITLETANGVSTGLLATAKSVRVGKALSTLIPIAVVDDTRLGIEDNVVGLLGMSFLSRFKLTVENNAVVITDRF